MDTNNEVEEALKNLKPEDLVAKFRTDMGIDLPEIQSSKILEVLDWTTMSHRMSLKTIGELVSKREATSTNTKEFASFLCNTMYANNGIGLAATQVNVPLRMFVMDCTQEEGFGKCPRIILNPVYDTASDKVTDTEEGCLSVPGLAVPMHRSDEITVTGRDLNWGPLEYTFTGIEAHAVQHEIDHLNGICIIDSLSKLKRDMYLSKIQKIKRQAKKLAKQMYNQGLSPHDVRSPI